MFKILSGQTEFNQWDSGQYVTGSFMEVGEQVIFQSATGATYVTYCFSKDGAVVAPVPNKLLQFDRPMLVNYGQCNRAMDQYDTHFFVNARPCPEGYVYTDNTNEGKPTPGGSGGSGGGSSVQSDWNQTDETAADFIKNKPFGEIPVVIVEEQDAEFPYDENVGGNCATFECGVEIVDGDILSVSLDGVKTKTTAVVLGAGAPPYFGNLSAMGIPGQNDTGEGYVGTYMGGMLMVIAFEGERHRVSIDKVNVEELDSIYIPKKQKVYIGSGDYLYEDIDLTVKLDKGKLSSIENIIVSEGVQTFVPVAYEPMDYYDRLGIFLGGEIAFFHTSEYTP